MEDEMQSLMIIPKQAAAIINDINNFPVTPVVDDQTNIVANENLKIVNKYWKEYLLFCEDRKKELYKPYKEFIDEIKIGEDLIKDWIFNQKKTIGSYSMELMRKENERRIEAQKQIDEERRKAAAEISAPVPEPTKPVFVEKSRVKTEFVNASVKMIPSGTITDIMAFLSALQKSKDGQGWYSLIVNINKAKLDAFCRDQGLNGQDKTFPGVQVTMTPDVRAGR
jgi:hypothetical protein